MAFDFLGTLSLGQLNELRNFLTGEVDSIELQLNTLRGQQAAIVQTRNSLVDAAQKLGDTNILDRIYDRQFVQVDNSKKVDDSNSAKVTEQIKKDFLTNIKFKRERLEFKIKKLFDAEEQLRETMDRKAFAKFSTTEKLNQLESMFTSLNSDHLFKTKQDMENYKIGSNV